MDARKCNQGMGKCGQAGFQIGMRILDSRGMMGSASGGKSR